MQINSNTLPKATAAVLEKIKNIEYLKRFYLSGGTALSLQMGHRESEDLDFFTKTSFDSLFLQRQLSQYGGLKNIMIEDVL